MLKSSFKDNLRVTISKSRSKLGRWILIFIAFATSFGILGWLVYRQRDILLNYEWTFRPWPVLLSFLFYIVALLLAFLVWSQILNSLGSQSSLKEHFRFYSVSNLAKRLPGTLWYVAWRMQLYKSQGISQGLVSIASGIELAIVVISGVIAILLFAIPIVIQYPLGLVVLGVLLFICLFVLQPRFLNWILRKFVHEPVVFRYLNLIKWIGLYLGVWLFGGLILFEVANFFYPLSISALSYVIGCWSLVSVLAAALFFFPTNFGFNELGFVLLLSKIIPAPIAVLIALSTRILIIVYEIIWAMISVVMSRSKKNPD